MISSGSPIGKTLLGALAALACCALFAGPALAAEGTVTGKVVRKDGKQPLPEAFICFEAVGVDGGRCAVPEADGTYTVHLTPHEYTVEFSDRFDFLATQYWVAAEFEEEAKPITVASGKTLSGISAEMTPGSEFEGIATAGGKPVAGIRVCAYPTGRPEPAECSETEEQSDSTTLGEYRMEGIPPNTYQVEFSTGESGLELADQWWEGKATRAEAKTLLLNPNEGFAGIDADLFPPAKPVFPAPAPAPIVSAPIKAAPKPLKCKKHFRKQKVHGKTRCVRVPQRKRHHRR